MLDRPVRILQGRIRKGHTVNQLRLAIKHVTFLFGQIERLLHICPGFLEILQLSGPVVGQIGPVIGIMRSPADITLRPVGESCHKIIQCIQIRLGILRIAHQEQSNLRLLPIGRPCLLDPDGRVGRTQHIHRRDLQALGISCRYRIRYLFLARSILLRQTEYLALFVQHRRIHPAYLERERQFIVMINIFQLSHLFHLTRSEGLYLVCRIRLQINRRTHSQGSGCHLQEAHLLGHFHL